MAMDETLHRNRATIVVGVAVVLVLAVVWLVFGRGAATGGTSLVALVHDSDGVTYELPLDEDATLEVTTELGRNVIAVEGGQVRMLEADCANGYCLGQHPIDAPGEQIICLPHELWVEVVAEGDAGGQMDEGAITIDDDGIDLQAG